MNKAKDPLWDCVHCGHDHGHHSTTWEPLPPQQAGSNPYHKGGCLVIDTKAKAICPCPGFQNGRHDS